MRSQTDQLYNLLLDNKPHCTNEIMIKIYGGEHLGLARVGARIYDIKKKYGIEINGWHDSDNPTLYWYQIVNANKKLPDIIERMSNYFEAWRTSQKTPLEKQQVIKVAVGVGYGEIDAVNALQWLEETNIIHCEEGKCVKVI